MDIEHELGRDAVIQTGSEMANIEGIIIPVPSLYVKPNSGNHYFVELTDGQHLFIAKKRIRKYIDNYEADEWEWEKYPDVRIVRKSKVDRNKLVDYVEEKMDDNYLDDDDFSFIIKQNPIRRRPKLIVA